MLIIANYCQLLPIIASYYDIKQLIIINYYYQMCGILLLVEFAESKLSDEQKLGALDALKPRGPDRVKYVEVNHNEYNAFIGFTRLAIMDVSDNGLQPFYANGVYSVTNGEIYNHERLIEEHDIQITSKSDCEVVLPLYLKYGFEFMIGMLDAEFATVIVDTNKHTIYFSRDRFGVRPLFMGSSANSFGISSELKAISTLMDHVTPVVPGNYYELNLLTQGITCTQCYNYDLMTYVPDLNNVEYIHNRINELLSHAVDKRLQSDRPMGFLLSGGLDSSLIVSIACRILGADNVTCFTIGLENSVDVLASIEVARSLGIKNHHIIKFTTEQGIAIIPEVIRAIESYDITTVRASTPQYLMAKYIAEHTDIKVILSGEGSDELNGSYRYFRDAPNVDELHWETIRLMRELYMFDNLRTDRTMASHGLEVRVPFLDFEFVDFVHKINPALKVSSSKVMEKMIVRDSFPDYLPTAILYRSKEAFSDAVSSKEVSWYNSIQAVVETAITDAQLASASKLYPFNTPETKEAYYYREVFESYYPDRSNVIDHLWLPRFQSKKVVDPSATILECY
jgi:asparagine synthase (glutamine-hydrolysing)